MCYYLVIGKKLLAHNIHCGRTIMLYANNHYKLELELSTKYKSVRGWTTCLNCICISCS